MSDRETLLFANDAFYQAFLKRDFQAMEELWSKQEPVSCLHPGWEPLLDRHSVMQSWVAILTGRNPPAISCRAPWARLIGDVGMVVCYEVIADQALIATNLYRREGSLWRLFHHQAGPADRPPAADDEDHQLVN